MTSESRQRRILEELQGMGRVEVTELAELLATSVITVRRDLDQLAALGALRRVRGGAVAPVIRGEGLPFGLRELDETDRKDRLARGVAALIDDGEAVVIDSGTTGAAVARALAGRRITALPMSVQGLAALAHSPTVQLMTPAGTVRPTEGSIVGPLVDTTLAALRFDTAVLTCCGASLEDGVTAYDMQDAAAKQALVRAARRTILIAEGSKFTRTAMAVVCSLASLDIVVTDDTAPGRALDTLREAGVLVVLA